MKINNITTKCKPNFKGDYWLTTDVHDKLPMYCGTLSEITNKVNSSKEKTSLLDNGDYFGRIFKLGATNKIIDNFKTITPDMNVVFNIGNFEHFVLSKKITEEEKKNGYNSWTIAQKEKVDYIKMVQELKSKNNKIHFISCFADDFENNCEVPKGVIESYVILDDIVDGEKKKVLILGTTTGNGGSVSIQDQKDKLKNVVNKIANNNEEYDYAILLSHNSPNTEKDKSFNEIIDYLTNELKVKNLKLAVGGHSHGIYNDINNKTKIVCPPSSGKGAIKAVLHKNELYLPEIPEIKDSHNYSILNQCSDKESVIANVDISNPLPVDNYYKDVMHESNPGAKKIMIEKMPIDLSPKDYGETLTNTSELGTFFANNARNITKSDFSFFIFSDFREKLPNKEQPLTMYNVNDTINIDKKIWIIEDVTPEILRNFFEEVFKNQRIPENGNMIEFSDNLKITRMDLPGLRQIKQIEFFENGEWHKLLRATGAIKEEFKDKKFKIATCSVLAEGNRSGLEMLSKKNGALKVYQYTSPNIDNKNLVESDVLYGGLKEAEKNRHYSLERSEVITKNVPYYNGKVLFATEYPYKLHSKGCKKQ